MYFSKYYEWMIDKFYVSFINKLSRTGKLKTGFNIFYL